MECLLWIQPQLHTKFKHQSKVRKQCGLWVAMKSCKQDWRLCLLEYEMATFAGGVISEGSGNFSSGNQLKEAGHLDRIFGDLHWELGLFFSPSGSGDHVASRTQSHQCLLLVGWFMILCVWNGVRLWLNPGDFLPSPQHWASFTGH